jgi:hypothetical protein
MAMDFMRIRRTGDHLVRLQQTDGLRSYFVGITVLFASFGLGWSKRSPPDRSPVRVGVEWSCHQIGREGLQTPQADIGKAPLDLGSKQPDTTCFESNFSSRTPFEKPAIHSGHPRGSGAN